MNSIYKIKAKHAGRDAYWQATILAPDLLTACMFLKKRAHAEEMPTIHEKNGRRYHRTGSRAYYRNAKLDLVRAGKKKVKVSVKALQDKADEANAEAEGKFHLCKIIEEFPYLT